MGYKYGLWYVYDQNNFPTDHIGHFTLTCFMELEDAFNLYGEIAVKIGKYNNICVKCDNPIKFECNMYENDDNNLYSWGYSGSVNNWHELEYITRNYKCNFSHVVHTSIQYDKNESNLCLEKCNNKVVNCKLHVVNICDDNPSNWFLIN